MEEFTDEAVALDALPRERFSVCRGIIFREGNFELTPSERAAINYLCGEWDYDYDHEAKVF